MVPENNSSDQSDDTLDFDDNDVEFDRDPLAEMLDRQDEAFAAEYAPGGAGALALQHVETSLGLRSHLRIAHLIASKSIGKLLNVAGLGWFVWDGKRFVPDLEDKGATRAVRDGIRALGPDALSDDDLYKDLKSAQTNSGVNGVLGLMAALEGITADVEELDADPLLLNVDNGVLDLRELEPGEDGEAVDWRSLTLHPHDPKHKMTQITRARFNADAVSGTWSTFLDRSLPELSIRDYLHRAVGVGLIGEQLEHLLPILAGAGRNGKGVLYGAMDHCLGSYSHVASPALFAMVKGDPNKPQPAFLTLRGKRLVWVSETAKDAEMDSALIKRLTGGDPITGRALHKNNEVTFDPTHLLMLITNHAPQLPADDPAVWARVRCVTWDVVIPAEERDPNLGKKLKRRADSEAVLAWALEGLAMYNHEGLSAPESVEAATDAYKADQDTVSRFVGERCDDDCPENDGNGTKTLHADYKRFCRANGVMEAHQLGEREFGTRLSELGYVQGKSHGRRFWRELKLLPSDMEARAAQSQQDVAQRAYDIANRPAAQSSAAPAPTTQPHVAAAPTAAPAPSVPDLSRLLPAGPPAISSPPANETIDEKVERLKKENDAMRNLTLSTIDPTTSNN